MKAVFVNGSPRKDWNTGMLVQAAMKGAEEAGAECELVNLYDLQMSGCRSCFACKVKGSTTNGVCAWPDDLKPVLESVMEADVLVVGSPVYFGNLTAGIMAFLERAEFAVLNYKKPENGVRPRTLPKEKKLGMIVDMGAGEAALEGPNGYAAKFEAIAGNLSRLLGNGECTMVYSCDTLQFTDYDRMDVNMFDVEGKKNRREVQFPHDLEHARELGKALVEQAR